MLIYGSERSESRSLQFYTDSVLKVTIVSYNLQYTLINNDVIV
jgi:hypothetical protein